MEDIDSDRAQLKTARALAIVLWLSPLRSGVTIRQVRDAIEGDWSERTIRRDLELLEAIGLVEKENATFRLLRSSRLDAFLRSVKHEGDGE